MATANLLWTVPSLTMIAPTPRPIQQLTFGQPPSHFTAGGSTAAEFFAFSLAHLVAGQLSRGERNGGFLTRREKIPARRAPFSYTPPTSSFTLRLSSRHAAMPITPVLRGSGGNMNSSSFWALSFWDNLAQTDEKFPRLCRAAKEDSTIAVAELKDDTQVAKRKFHRSTRRSGGEQSRKIYAIIAGASFCAVVVIFSIVLPKQQGLRGKVDPELLYTSLEKFFSDLRCKVVPKLSSVSWEKILGIAPAWISILLACYELNDKQNMGKMRNRKPSKKQPITFDDVEGVDAAKVELLEIVLCMEEDSKYMKLGAKVPRGVLLAGPPGTGKTLLARAVAGEADVAFFSISASEFVEIYVGRGAAHVRDLFREARKRSPSIIFIDEIDAIGGQRGKGQNCEGDQTLNQLLTEMDGFEKDAKVVVIAATNRPESLDSALMRPGRFSRKVFVGEPDLDARRKIFSLYLQKVPMKEDKEAICDLVASLTPGLVGADLENIANEAVLLAARRDDDFVTKEDVLQAVERAKTKNLK